MLGQIDYSKEVLIPRTNGAGQAGFDVVNPLYCYEGCKVSMKNLMNGGDPINLERAAIIVNRGWIPAHLRDKRSRPMEVNSRKLVKVQGVWRASKDVHDYSVPNDPDNNDWNNMCCEDIGIFWDLPNWDEAKWYYFQAVDTNTPDNNLFQQGSGITPISKDELIDEHYGWRWHENTHQRLEQGYGLTTIGLAALAFLSV